MLNKYNNFLLNEAKINDLKNGDFILIKNEKLMFSPKLKKYVIVPKNKIAICSDVEIKYRKNEARGNTIILDILDDDWKPEYDCYFLVGDSIHIVKFTEEEAHKYKDGKIVRTQLSVVLEKILREIEFKITEKYTDIDFVDVDKNDNNLVSYVMYNKCKNVRDEKLNKYDNRYRQTMRIGKFLQKMNKNIIEKDIENFIAEYKAKWEKLLKDVKNRIIVVTGKDIAHWYLGDGYGKDIFGNGGILGSSCMRYAKSQRRFKIYIENPDKCALAIYLDKNDKLMARALIWKIDKPTGIVYMDRIYYADVASHKILYHYGKENNMKMYGEYTNSYNGMEIQLTKDFGDPYSNPYMDTFRYFYRNDMVLCSTSNIRGKGSDCYISHD